MLRQAVFEAGMMRVAGTNEVVGIPNSVGRDATAIGNTITPQELYNSTYVRSGPTAQFTDTLPTAALMNTAFPEVTVGQQWIIDIVNVTGVVMLLASGAGFTVVATAPNFVGSGCIAKAIITKTGAAAWTFEVVNSEMRPTNVVVKDAAAAGVAITTAELYANVYKRSGPAANFTDTLPLGTAMDTAFSRTTPIGDGWLIDIANASGVIMTIAPAAGFTFVAGSPTTIAANTRVMAQLVRTAANTWTIDILA